MVQAPAPTRASDPTRWKDLVASLRKLQAAEWAKVGESGAIPEIQAFAQQLRTLGQSKSCPPLADYAEALAREADLFAVAVRHLAARAVNGELLGHIFQLPNVTGP